MAKVKFHNGPVGGTGYVAEQVSDVASHDPPTASHSSADLAPEAVLAMLASLGALGSLGSLGSLGELAELFDDAADPPSDAWAIDIVVKAGAV